MKEWEESGSASIIMLIAGFAMIIGATMIEVPSRYRTFLGIPYDFNPAYGSLFELMMSMMIFGFLFLGFGIGAVVGTYSIYKLEKKLDSFVRVPVEGKKGLFCRYCGKENKSDAKYCEVCGKKF